MRYGFALQGTESQQLEGGDGVEESFYLSLLGCHASSDWLPVLSRHSGRTHMGVLFFLLF